MGITGLLPALKQIQEPTTLARYRGKTLAVDTYAWLHKSVITCPMELAQELPTTKYVNYVVKKIEMLKYFGITPYLVFDGDYLPCKKNTEIDRETRRKEYKKQGLQALNKGDHRTAFNCFQKSCDITPQMAKALIDVLRQRGVQYVVAPYEADSQMVYLEKMGIVDGIISEDSDLLIFGCHRLITKLNDRGECIEINRDNFKKCRQVPVHYLSQEQLRMVAALSGCDYTKGIPGIGIIKAFNLVKKYGSMDKILLAMKLENKYKIPTNFMEEFESANLAFQFQLIFDPISGVPAHLTDIPEHIPPPTTMLHSYSGERLDDDIHRQIAFGELHPSEKTPLISREAEILARRGIPMRAASWQQQQSNTMLSSSGVIQTPVKVAARAYSTPVSTVSNKRTIDDFFSSGAKKIQKQAPLPYATPNSTSKEVTILQNNKHSPSVKRKRILCGAGTTTKQPVTVAKEFSRFFNNPQMNESRPEQKTEETQILQDIDKKDSQISTKGKNTDFNSSEFELDDLSDDDSETILTNKSITEVTTTITTTTKEQTTSNDTDDDDDDDDISESGSSPAKIIEDARQGLKSKFGFNSNRPALQLKTSNELNQLSSCSTTTSQKTNSIMKRTKKLNLDDFIFKEN